MKTKKLVTIKELKIDSITCDKCGKFTDTHEMLHYTSIEFTAGYASPFGDMNKVSVDFCEHCYYELLIPYARIEHGTF